MRCRSGKAKPHPWWFDPKRWGKPALQHAKRHRPVAPAPRGACPFSPAPSPRSAKSFQWMPFGRCAPPRSPCWCICSGYPAKLDQRLRRHGAGMAAAPDPVWRTHHRLDAMVWQARVASAAAVGNSATSAPTWLARTALYGVSDKSGIRFWRKTREKQGAGVCLALLSASDRL